jgi:hypothetical protein
VLRLTRGFTATHLEVLDTLVVVVIVDAAEDLVLQPTQLNGLCRADKTKAEVSSREFQTHQVGVGMW